jgi:hypothetical protein
MHFALLGEKAARLHQVARGQPLELFGAGGHRQVHQLVVPHHGAHLDAAGGVGGEPALVDLDAVVLRVGFGDGRDLPALAVRVRLPYHRRALLPVERKGKPGDQVRIVR